MSNEQHDLPENENEQFSEIHDEEQEVQITLNEDQLNSIKDYQNLNFAIVGGLLLALLGAIIWAAISISTGYQIGYLAIGLGVLVGFGIRYFGAGITSIYGIIGAVYSLLSCVLGNFLAQIGFIAEAENFGFLQVFSFLNFDIIKEIMIGSFSPVDLLFYFFAASFGYNYSFRKVTEEQLYSGNFEPQLNKMRRPLVVATLLAVLGAFFYLNSGTGGLSGVQTFKNESGNVMSKGEIIGGFPNGYWEYFHANGNLRETANYDNGLEDGAFNWYNEDGKIIEKGFYKKGLQHGKWTGYFANGNTSYEDIYVEGRTTGKSISYFENGQVKSTGEVLRNKRVGEWKTFYDNGKLSEEANYKNNDLFGSYKTWYQNGKPALVQEYLEDEKPKFISAFEESGKQVVKDGNGTLSSYFADGKIASKTTISNGFENGKSLEYYQDGKLKQEGIYKDGKYKIQTRYDKNGNKTVENGNGSITNYSEAKPNMLISEVEVKYGMKNGTMSFYDDITERLLLKANYKADKKDGMYQVFNQDGSVGLKGQYKNGKREGEWIWYDGEGNLSSKVSYVNDKKDGKQIFYNLFEKVVKEELYKNGELVEEKLFDEI